MDLSLLSGAALTASASGTSIGDVTSPATSLLTWALSSFSSIVTWVLGNPLAATITVMFVVGFAVSLLVRVLHSM